MVRFLTLISFLRDTHDYSRAFGFLFQREIEYLITKTVFRKMKNFGGKGFSRLEGSTFSTIIYDNSDYHGSYFLSDVGSNSRNFFQLA